MLTSIEGIEMKLSKFRSIYRKLPKSEHHLTIEQIKNEQDRISNRIITHKLFDS